MTLYKIEDFAPNYQQESFEGKDIKQYVVKAGTTEARVGFVRDILVDELGHFRYFVVETGFWIFGKKVLLPIGRALIDSEKECIYAIGIGTIKQAEALPEYHENMVINYEYEETVRANYRSPKQNQRTYDVGSYDYSQEQDLYSLNEKEGNTFKLYEERLIANKQRQKTGEVSIGKKVKTETAAVSVPVEKEKVVIERHSLNNDRVIIGNQPDFIEDDAIKMNVYEEKATIDKEAFIREEVEIRKEVERDTITAQENLRKEELEVTRDKNDAV